MGGIILIIIVVFVSVMIRKVATVALELSGLDSRTSSFQALIVLQKRKVQIAEKRFLG